MPNIDHEAKKLNRSRKMSPVQMYKRIGDDGFVVLGGPPIEVDELNNATIRIVVLRTLIQEVCDSIQTGQ